MPMHIHLGRSSAFLFPRCPVRPARSCRCWARWSRPRPAASGPLRDRRRCGCRSRRSRGNRGEALVRDPTCRGGNWSFATRHRTAAESRRGAGRNQASVASLASKYPVEITVTCLWRIGGLCIRIKDAKAPARAGIVVYADEVFQARYLVATAGFISGSGVDPQQTGVPSAKVTVKNTATNATYSAETDRQGRFVSPVLLSGVYALSSEDRTCDT